MLIYSMKFQISSSEDLLIAEKGAHVSDMTMQKKHETEREGIRARLKARNEEIHARFELEKIEIDREKREMHERFALEKKEIDLKAKNIVEEANSLLEETLKHDKKSLKRQKNTKDTTTKTSRKS